MEVCLRRRRRSNPIVRSGPALALCLDPISCFSPQRNMRAPKLSSRPKVGDFLEGEMLTEVNVISGVFTRRNN